jgi:hypothetical protein
MKIGFWNIERSGNLGSSTMSSRDRAGLLVAHLNGWLKSAVAPDVLIMCEATSGGSEFILKEVGKAGPYHAEYVRVRDKNGNTSPCSFIVVAKRGYWRGCDPIGATTKRPYIKLDTGDLIVAGCHILAERGENSASEIFAMAADLSGEKKACVLIGDMNYLYDEDAKIGGGWAKVEPGIPATHKSHSSKPGSVIDYAWVDPRVGKCKPVVVMNYTDWDTIDHAPICYDVHV